MLNTTGRHPGVVEFADAFEFSHLPSGLPQDVSRAFNGMAEALLLLLPDGPALTRALHKLWEAKNEAVLFAVRTSGKLGPVRTSETPSGVDLQPNPHGNTFGR
jgi:hypothetical protein